ncbi:insulinase family protein [Candidatus Uhrbacteria bacterium]|nr:insulinase family protein [Candidatus Uhrbacteria bacterium]
MQTTYTLPNNVRVVLSPLKETKTVTALVLFGVGSRYEQKKINGISHFIEHMMFKGTKKRPTALSISKELDAVGAEFNAYTTKEVTGYWVKLVADKLDLALDLVSDMLYNSKFESEEIEREKKVICEELHMYRDNPAMYVDTLLEKIMFEPSSLGWDIGGQDEIILSLSRATMVKFRNSHYHGKNLVVGIAGNFDTAEGLEKVKRYFGDSWERGQKANVFLPYRHSKTTKPQILVHYKDTEQIQCAFGFHAYPYRSFHTYAAKLLSIILGGSMSSRLFTAVRERRGLCYSISASHQSFHDAGVFSVQAGLDKSRIHLALGVILDELKKVAQKGVTEAELRRAKDFLKGKMALQFEDSENVVTWYVTQEVLTKKMLTPEEKFERFAKVSRADIARVAKDLFRTSRIHLAIIGPYKDSKEFEKLMRI